MCAADEYIFFIELFAVPRSFMSAVQTSTDTVRQVGFAQTNMTKTRNLDGWVDVESSVNFGKTFFQWKR